MRNDPASTSGFAHGRHPLGCRGGIQTEMVLQGFQRLQWGDRRLVDGIRWEKSEQARGFVGQALGPFGQNVSVVYFDFNRPITHVSKLRLNAFCRKR